MPDYLSRLLDRARGVAPLLERRIPQPFEASTDARSGLAHGPALASAETDSADELPSAPTGDSPMRAGGAHPPTHAESPREAVGAIPPTDAGSRAEVRVVAARVERVDARSADAPARASTATAPDARATRRAAPRALDAATVLTAGVVEQAPSRPDERARARAEPPPNVRHPRQTDDAPNQLVRAVPVTDAPPPHAAAPARDARAPFAPVAPVAPVAPRIAPVPSAVAPSSPAPTIHVSIGRIEVRAVPAAPSPRQRNVDPAVPRLSLDAYLRSRTGGGP